MGIKLNLYLTKPATYYEIMRDRLEVCFEAVRFFHKGLFFTQDAEVWFTAPSEALGGSLARRVPARNPYEATEILHKYLKELPFEDARRTFVLFRGIWQFNETRLEGYFSIQNSRKWREVYGDIDISAYARGEFEDLVDAFWLTQDMPTLIPKFIKSLEEGIRKTRFGLSQVTFSRGIPTKEDPTNLMAVYLVGERRSLLRIFYGALRESRDRSVIIKAKPLHTPFLLNTLVKQEIVNERINRRLREAMVVERKDKSALYIAKERDSFAKLYNDISKSILRPALGKLPKEDVVREMIERGLEEYRE